MHEACELESESRRLSLEAEKRRQQAWSLLIETQTQLGPLAPMFGVPVPSEVPAVSPPSAAPSSKIASSPTRASSSAPEASPLLVSLPVEGPVVMETSAPPASEPVFKEPMVMTTSKSVDDVVPPYDFPSVWPAIFKPQLQRSVSGSVSYPCPFPKCPETEISKMDPCWAHIAKEHTQRQAKCPGCDVLFVNPESMRVHLKKFHNQARFFGKLGRKSRVPKRVSPK